MPIRSFAHIAAAMAALSLAGGAAQAQSCGTSLPAFQAAMEANSAEALASYLADHAPCFEVPAQARLKALGGTPVETQTDAVTAAPTPPPEATVAEPGLPSDTSCQDFADARSERWDQPLDFRIINRTSEMLTVSWINYEGQREAPTDLAPGGTYGGGTFVTHPFEVNRIDGSCVKIVMPQLDVPEYFVDIP